MNKRFWFSGALVVFLGSFIWLFSVQQDTKQFSPEVVHTIYGDTEVSEPVLLDLIHSQAFTRLKKINQYGVDYYIRDTIAPYTRYTHSLGVFFLLRKYGASLKEQMAGLLHDVSHTVFSHVGDHVAAQLNNKLFDQNDDAYQDCVHVLYLKRTDIASILARHKVAIEDMDHKNGSYRMLERELPDMCTDRLEYVLYGGYIEGWLTESEIHTLLDALHYEKGDWFFDDAVQAKKFAEISIRLCEEIFASGWNIGSYEWAAKGLLRGVELGVISMQDIHFGRDDEVWQLLCRSNDPVIQKSVHNILHAKNLYQVGTKDSFDLHYVAKFRGINPWVKTSDGLKRLTHCDTAFSQYYAEAKNSIGTPRYYKEIVA